jgi:hypothetical protein
MSGEELAVELLSNVAAFDDGLVLDLLAVSRDPKTGSLSVTFFSELRDGGIKVRKRVDWETAVPETARLFIASAGTGVETIQMSWTGWCEGTLLKVLSLYRETPVDLELSPADQLIATPVIGPDRSFHLYAFSPTDTGFVLVCHLVTGEADAEPEHKTEKVVMFEGAPRFAVLDPIAGDAGTVAIAWIEMVGDQGFPTAILRSPAGVRRIRGRVPTGLRVLEIAQPGLHIGWNVLPPEIRLGSPQRRLTMALMAERIDSGACVLMELEFDFDHRTGAVQLHELPIAAGKVEWAAIAYKRSLTRATPVSLVKSGGEVFLWNDPTLPLRTIGVDISSGPPSLLRGINGIYRVVFVDGVPIAQLLA